MTLITCLQEEELKFKKVGEAYPGRSYFRVGPHFLERTVALDYTAVYWSQAKPPRISKNTSNT